MNVVHSTLKMPKNVLYIYSGFGIRVFNYKILELQNDALSN